MDFMRPPEMSFTDGGMVDLAVSENLADDLATTEATDVEFTDVTGDPPIALDTIEWRKLMSRLKLDLGHAKDKKRRVDDRAYQDRQAYDLDDKVQEYEGQPNLTTPGTRAKVDSVVGHVLSTIDVQPFFSARPETPESVDIAPIYEAALERELKLADSLGELLDTPQEAATVGTAIVGFELVTRPSGEIAIATPLTRLENFFCYPVATNDFSKCTTFRRFKLPYWEVQRQANDGLYDLEAVRLLRGDGSGENLTKEEGDDNSGGDTPTFDENRMVELYEAYYRYMPADGDEATLWQVIFSEAHERPLALRENPYKAAFDAPPFAPARFARKSRYVFGVSIPTLMRSPQKIMDDSMNDMLAYGQLARTPVIEVDRNSSLFRTYGESGYKMRPGDMIQRNGSKDSGLNVVQFPPAGNAMNEMQVANEMGDTVTFNDHMLQGDNYAGGRRTKYEVQSAYGSSATKLRNYMRTYSRDMLLVSKMVWALFDAFKVEPEGLYSVTKDGETGMLSSEGTDKDALQMELQTITQELMMNPETAVEANEKILLDSRNGAVVKMGDLEFKGGGIPSSRRDDITFSLTGTAISADQQAEQEKLIQWAQFMQMVPYGQQDTMVYHYLKRLALSFGFLDFVEFIGSDPRQVNPQAYMEAMALMQQQTQKSSLM